MKYEAFASYDKKICIYDFKDIMKQASPLCGLGTRLSIHVSKFLILNSEYDIPLQAPAIPGQYSARVDDLSQIAIILLAFPIPKHSNP